ncbi:MAG: hypothetical protein ACI89L_002743 [Phycisphaerales bacterium]|jgi:hypothetical protein
MTGVSMMNVLTDPNPLFMKSFRSRMRGVHLMSWGVVTLTVTTFVSLLIFFIQTKQLDVEPRDAAKAVIPAVLIIQAVLLMMVGTGAVAHGIAEERDEGLVAYQRMTPMSPTAKILGYLFGLPAREYALVALTMPFVIVATVYSGFSVLTLLHFYMVFFVSAWVYHMTGLMAGMVWPKPRLAVFLSMGMVLVLYFALPNLSRLGITFFEHLTIRPTLFGMVWNELPASMRPRAEMSGIDGFRPIPWFGGSMHQTVYTMLVQGFVLAVMFSVIHRKWRRENSHLFSKVGGLVVFGGVVVFMLSSLWAMIAQDEVYQSVFGGSIEPNQFVEMDDGRVFWTSSNPPAAVVERQPEMLLVLLMVPMALLGALYLLMTTWITSGRNTAIEGWRRARKHGTKRLGWNSDAASSLPACAGMIAMVVVAGASMIMMASKQQAFYAVGPTWDGALLAIVAMVGAGLFVQAMCERLSGRVFGVAMFLLWMIPFFASIIMEAAFEMYEVGLLVAMPCPPVMMLSSVSIMMDTTTAAPGVETQFVLPGGEYPNFAQITRIGVYGYLVTGVLAQVWRLRHRRRVCALGMSEGSHAPAATELTGPASGLADVGGGEGAAGAAGA